LPGCGQRKGEHTALAYGAGHSDLAAEFLHNAFGDAEAQAMAFRVFLVQPGELLEQLRQLVLWDPGTVVRNPKPP
jgi:hypothetical protein